MSRATVSVSRSSRLSAVVGVSPVPLAVVVAICRSFKKDIFDPYRPELHYMRGPGPKSRERSRAQFQNGEVANARANMRRSGDARIEG
jgi:hypothetical protein